MATVLRVLVFLCAAFVFATLAYSSVVLVPKVAEAKSAADSADRQVPKVPPTTSWSEMSPAEQARIRAMQDAASEATANAYKVSTRYLDLRGRREEYTIIAMLVGGLAFLLSIGASWKTKKGILIFGILTAVIGVVGHLGTTMAQDGHL